MAGDRSGGEIMDFVTAGSTGVQVSPLCFGTMSFGSEADEQTSTEMFHRVRDAGIKFFDTADAYGDGASEKILGTLIADGRDEVVLGSKVFNPTGNPARPRRPPKSGRLVDDPRNVDRYSLETDFATADRFTEFAQRLDVKPATLAVAWTMSRPDVTAASPGHRPQRDPETELGLTVLVRHPTPTARGFRHLDGTAVVEQGQMPVRVSASR
jgi:aryl-alcohol dehydrogenase-like predicted oxidoreductase